MNREWVTLAFGIVLVAGVAVVSVWQNYPAAEESDPTEPSAAQSPASAPADAAGDTTSEAGSEAGSKVPTRRAAATPPSRQPRPAAPPAPQVDARVPVVHKHRFGDCEGTLHAAPGTLTYATEHTEDGFQLTFADIEAFDLDPDEKNLRIRRRGGKTWNFTTRGEAAAALAAFHKDATRARR